MTEQENNLSEFNEAETLEKIKRQISENSVIIYMKGKPQSPQCGFSATAVKALAEFGKPFAFVNILENPDIRATLHRHSNWPTFPQLFINQELIGGSDIIEQMHASGELLDALNKV